MWALVPIKLLDRVKSRLAGLASPGERRALALAMARDVLAALAGARRLTGILLVSRAEETRALADEVGALRFRESRNANLPQALDEARQYASRSLAAQGVFIVPADAPLIESSEIDALIKAHESVTLLPDRAGLGTNGLILTPPDAMPLVFDGKSFKPHLALARAAGLRPRVASESSLALDIDTAEDLARLLRAGPDSRTAALLHGLGLAQRLGAADNAQPQETTLGNSTSGPTGEPS